MLKLNSTTGIRAMGERRSPSTLGSNLALGQVTPSRSVRREAASNADVTGVDSSAEMLAEARTYAGIRWQLADLGEWRPREPYDVVCSNAALHWHFTLYAFKRLFIVAQA